MPGNRTAPLSTTARGLGYQWQRLTVECKRVYPDICHRCHQAIDRNLPKTHVKSYTVDHLDARADHGPQVPTIDRVRPAHRDCNSSRGADSAPASPRSRLW